MSKKMKNNSLSKALSKSIFAVLTLMILGLANLAVSAQQQVACNIAPTTTVTEGNLAPGGIAAFTVTSGAYSVTVDHVNAGTGLQSFTVLSATNAIVVIPGFTPGTFDPVTATFTPINSALPVDFTLRAASTYHAANIRVQCSVPAPPPPPPPPAVTGCTLTQGYWKNHEKVWSGPVTLGTRSYTKEQLLAIFGQPVRGNGLISLAHQLIAAKLNKAAGASVPKNVQDAIDAADALIGNLVVGGNNGGYLSPDLTSMLTSILDQYNNGLAPGGPPHCSD